MAAWLIDQGGTYNYQDEINPLSIGIQNKNVEMVKVLGNTPDSQGYTPLMREITAGNTARINLLINMGVNINIRTERGTALTIATNTSNEDIVELLIEKGGDIDQTDNQGNTPLMHVAQTGNVTIYLTLVSNNANIDLTNENGETAENIATNNGHTRIANGLKEIRLNDEALKNISDLFSILKNFISKKL